MREDGAGCPGVSWRNNPIIARIVSAAAHLSGAVLLATGVDGSLAARRKQNGDGNNGRDRDGDGERNRDKPRDEDRKADKENRDVEREQADKADGDRDRDRDRKNDDKSSTDDESDVNDEQQDPQDDGNRDDEPRNDEDADDPDRDGEGGRSNAGSGLFDNPLATKARRRSNDFENRDRRDEEEEDGVFVDVDPEAESVYQTDSISFATGPDGVEILTKNITYIAAPTPTPTPIPRLEFPERDGYPFGEDFPFGVARPRETPTAAAPTDPGDGGRERPDPGDAPPDDADIEPSAPPSNDTDGGDNSMDFSS